VTLASPTFPFPPFFLLPSSLPPPSPARIYVGAPAHVQPASTSVLFSPCLPSFPPCSLLLSMLTHKPTHTHAYVPGKGKGGGSGRWCARKEANGGKGGAAPSSPGSRPCPGGKAGRRASIISV
jgi:hypothetical protein